MRSRLKIVLLLVLFTSIAGIAFESRQAARYTRQLETQPVAIAHWEQQIQKLRAAAAARDITTSNRSAPAPAVTATPPPAPSDPTRARQTQAWVERTKRLKAWFAQHPGERIPELELLDDQSWLSLTREARLDTETEMEAAGAALRNSAKNHFAQLMRQALLQYVAANHGRLPVHTLDLLRYFPSSIHDYAAMLERYEMVRAGSIGDAPPEHFLTEKTDGLGAHDERVALARGKNGELFIETHKPNSREEEERKVKAGADRAILAFMKIHHGQKPATPAQLLPYFDPPLNREFAQRLNRPLTPTQQKSFNEQISRVADKK